MNDAGVSHQDVDEGKGSQEAVDQAEPTIVFEIGPMQERDDGE